MGLGWGAQGKHPRRTRERRGREDSRHARDERDAHLREHDETTLNVPVSDASTRPPVLVGPPTNPGPGDHLGAARAVSGPRRCFRLPRHEPEGRSALRPARGQLCYCSAITCETGSPIIVPIRPYPAIVVPVMQVVIIMPPAVQSAYASASICSWASAAVGSEVFTKIIA